MICFIESTNAHKTARFFFLHFRSYKRKSIAAILEETGNSYTLPLFRSENGTKEKKKIFPGLLPYFQSVSVKMKIIRTVSLNV